MIRRQVGGATKKDSGVSAALTSFIDPSLCWDDIKSASAALGGSPRRRPQARVPGGSAHCCGNCGRPSREPRRLCSGSGGVGHRMCAWMRARRWFQSITAMPIILKGVQTAEDAVRPAARACASPGDTTAARRTGTRAAGRCAAARGRSNVDGTAATPGLGSPRPRLHRDWAHPSSERATGRLTDPPSTTYPHGACRASSKHLQRQGDFTKVLAQPAQPGRPAGRSALGVLQSLATDANRALSDATAYGRVALACLRHRRSDAFSAGGGYRCSRGSMTV